MQKISFYLLSNRITVRTDRTGFTTENRQVYQRKLRLYKGIDNRVEFEVLNGDSRRENIVGYHLVLSFFDAYQNILFTSQGQAETGKPGIMSATVSAADIANIDPQMLRAAAQLVKDTEKRILYADSQYDLAITVDLMDGFNSDEFDIQELTVFNFEFDRKASVSEIAYFGRRANNDPDTRPIKEISVELQGDYQGIVEVEATRTNSTAIGNQYQLLEQWNVAETPTKTYSGDFLFVRFIHSGRGPGTGASFNIVIDNGEYQLVSVIHRGQGYRIGDELVIKGSFLGGDDEVNDLTITVLGVNEHPVGSINTTKISWSGTPGIDNGYFRNLPAQTGNIAGSVDKIIIKS